MLKKPDPIYPLTEEHPLLKKALGSGKRALWI